MVKRRTGLDPLAYMGVEPSMPAQFVREGRNPTTTDYEGYNIGTVWIVKGTNAVFMLVDKALFIATWRQFTAGVSALNTLTGDVGGIVPATANNIDIFGSGPFVFTGNPGMSLLTLSSNGTLATQYDADIGSAIPVAGVLNIVGGPHVQTTAVGNTITISPMGSVAVSIPCDIGAAVPAGGTLNVFGGNNITTTGAANTVTIDVTGTTDNALQRGNATGSLTSLVVGTDGQVVIGATGGAPAFATLASAGGTILFTPGANTLNLESAGTGALTSVPCDVGAAAPLLSVLNAFGGDNITTTGAGNTVTIAVSGTGQFAPQMGNAAGSLDDIGLMTDGELIIGSTGLAPQINTLTAGTGIMITNAPGSITIDATGGSTGGVKITTFNASGMFTKDANSKMIYYLLVGGGSGGGSGARRAAGVATSGGAGGGVQGSSVYMIPSDHLGATENVTIGAGSLGGAAILIDNTDGNYAESSTASYFGTTYPFGGGRQGQFAPGFNIAVGGRSGGDARGNSVGATYYFLNFVSFAGTIVTGGWGQLGAAGQDGAPGFTGLDYFFTPLPGGAGGGISAGNSVFSGGDGAIISIVTGATPANIFIGTAAAGGAAGVSGVDGDDATAVESPFCGAGFGAGGGGSHLTNPGNGGNGGFPGGGAGGGGSVHNGNPSGAGGDGGDGQLIIYEFLGV